jgi:hypothetical protein
LFRKDELFKKLSDEIVFCFTNLVNLIVLGLVASTKHLCVEKDESPKKPFRVSGTWKCLAFPKALNKDQNSRASIFIFWRENKWIHQDH